MMTKNAIVTHSVLVLLLLGLVGGFECNNLKRFRCKRGGKARVNGCTWAKDAFKKYRHFPITKKKLFGVCLNAGQSESQVFGTPAEQCDCGTKCKRKCKTKSGYKKKCYFAGPRLGGTCLPNRHFADSADSSGCAELNLPALNDTTLTTAFDAWKLDENTAATTYGDISCWNTSEVITMQNMFKDAAVFNGDLSKWDTSKVRNMESAFEGAAVFNGDISTWDTSEVTSMESAFEGAAVFNGDISTWDTSKVTTMKEMFFNAEVFNGNLSTWATSEVTTMGETFRNAAVFNSDLSKWDVSKATSMTNSFQGADAFDCSNHLPATTFTNLLCNN